MVKKQVYIVFLWLATSGAAHALVENRAVVNLFFSDDTDNTRSNIYALGYEKIFSAEQFLGVAYGTRQYHGEDSPNKDNSFDELKVSGRKQLTKQTHFYASVSSLNSSSWNPELYNFNLGYQIDDKWYTEAYLEREVIETASAIENHYLISTSGFSLEYRADKHNLFNTSFYEQSVTDGNQRNGSLLQYRYNPSWSEHIFFKLRLKRRDSSFDPAQYFSPSDFEQRHVFIGYETKFSEMHLKAEFGQGKQYINNNSESAREFSIGLRGWITRQGYLDSSLGCNTDGGTDNYRYCYGRLVVNYLW